MPYPNLGKTVVQLKAMGINDIINFDFMDPPPIQVPRFRVYDLGSRV